MSDTVVHKFADHPLCPADARLTSTTASHKLLEKGAATTGTTHKAENNSAVLRAALTLHPRLIRYSGSQPPATLPTLATL